MNFNDLHAANLGKQVETANGILAIGNLIEDKTGKLKSGDKCNYVALTNEAGEVVADLHPRNAQALFTKGEAEGIKMLVAATAEAAPEVTEQGTEATATTEAVPAKPKKEKKAKVEKEPAEPKGPSKKEQCVAMYVSMTAEGKTRKEILAAFATVGVSGPGAATYYQNCKSNKAGWTGAKVEKTEAAAPATTEAAPEVAATEQQ